MRAEIRSSRAVHPRKRGPEFNAQALAAGIASSEAPNDLDLSD